MRDRALPNRDDEDDEDLLLLVDVLIDALELDEGVKVGLLITGCLYELSVSMNHKDGRQVRVTTYLENF